MINALLFGLALAVAGPVAVFGLEVLVALWPRRARSAPALAADTRLAVLIPAHNEAAVIEGTLKTLLPTVPAGGRVLVVADNCTDATAAIARQCGADVVERLDATRRGKGFALEFGIQHLKTDPPAVVVFLDADCRVAADTIGLLGAAAIEQQRPVQGLNLCDPAKDGDRFQFVSGLAFRFKNLVRTIGLSRLAGLCHLTGTGMALPWQLVTTSQLASSNVVEDMQLGIDLALAGRPALFLPEARVDSPLPQCRSAVRTQRTRWEHGHLRTLLTQAPRLFGLALAHRRGDLLWLALDLAIPPLSLLTLAVFAANLVCSVVWLMGGTPVPMGIAATGGMVLVLSVLAGWSAYCREVVPLTAILAAPWYAAVKLPIYLAFLWKRQSQWIRTARAPAIVRQQSTEYSVPGTPQEHPTP